MTIRRRSGRPRYRWAALNAKLNGQLADLLVEWDEQATPWAEVVDRLQVMTGERVMIVTARRWTERAYHELGKEPINVQ